MAVYQIVQNGDEVLRMKAKEVKEVNDSIRKLLTNLKDTMYDANGAGLAAPQIGISKRVIVVDAEDDLLELVNPEIIECEGSYVDVEGCLSVPGLSGEVERSMKVKVRALDREGKEVEITREGLTARALQHEIDHLDGILYIDKATNIRKIEQE
ncbi:MAG: peptide deformylase [Peptococcia bacterium]